MKQFKKYLSILLITLVMTVQNIPFALADEVVSDPGTQSSEIQVTTTPAPADNTTPTVTPAQEQQNISTPTPPPPTPTLTKDQQDDINRAAEYEARKAAWAAERDARKQAAADAAAAAAIAAANAASNPTSNSTSAPTTGADNSVKTGDGTNTALIQNNANNNIAGSGPSATVGGSGGGASVANTGNGSGSSNNGSAVIGNNNSTNQNNSANVNSNLNQSTTTGSNNVSGNTGGDSSIKTGDANVSGTVVTTLNTNAAGVMVSEFNVNDDHVGDIVLDFAANCVSGCGGGSVAASNTGNGVDSTNNAGVSTENNNQTFQNNDANVGNELVLSANSGDNTSSKNTNGDSSIKTGDANVSANVVTLANNNLAGNVIYGVVNVFGNLVGDIILTDAMMNACCGTGNATAANTGNGSDSTNNSNISQSNNDNTFQNNDATINNNLILNGETGNNDASNNTGGESTIKSGDTTVQANVLNIANSNILGGNMWLVIVNEAGHWVGKIMGAPAGQKFSGGDGSEFMVDENGYITASINAGNGADSTNNSDVSQSNNNSTTQNNNANINNTLDLSANTGGNASSKNTGGDSNITTGDAKIVANLVNFVNNNIAGKGKLFVTVINVFGSWMGDFVSPGQKKEDKSTNPETLADNKGGGNHNAPTPTVTPITQSSTVTKKTKKVTISSGSSTEAVMGASDVNSDGVLLASNIKPVKLDKKALVKEASYDNVSDSAESKGLTVNLAWLLVLGPIGIIAVIGKRYIYRKFLPTPTV